MKVPQILRRFVWHEWGGIETVVAGSATALQAGGVQAPVLCTAALAEPGFQRERGLDVYRFSYGYGRVPLTPDNRRALDLKGGNPSSPGLLWWLLSEPGLSLVSCHTMGRLAGHVRWACALRRIPYAITLHGGHFCVPAGEKQRLRAPTRGSIDLARPLDWALGSRRILEDAAAIFALSTEEAAHARVACPHVPIFQLRNGVDLSFFALSEEQSRRDAAEWRGKCQIPQHARLIVCVARLDPQKGQDLLLEAAARLPNNTHVALIGPESVPGQSQALREAANRLGLGSRVHLLGPMSPVDPALAVAYAAADVVALASRHEPFGVVLLEAWAARRPVVAFAVGGIPSFVEHEITGLLAPPGDVGALAEALSRALCDNSLSQRLVETGFDTVKSRFAWAIVAAEIESHYRQAIGIFRQRQK